jgi:hypothetical protein
MGIILEPQSYSDIQALSSAFAMAIQSGLLSREQASSAFKEQLYTCGIVKRPVIQPKPEVVKKK